ncbi:hypothetical protein C0Q70_19191 [Pomacea canaliculata]|uniref:Uncharacterized protein n=1 Tax=Pomacea canaliculata TaxID=400727 RepID=A0A2T7NIP1_POMCA|nr:hypothetical protein C0Q70_19191 [Pomacea canaliculata]
MAFTGNTLTLVLLAVLLVATTADLRLRGPNPLAGRGQEVDVLLDTNRAKSRIQPPHQQQKASPEKQGLHRTAASAAAGLEASRYDACSCPSSARGAKEPCADQTGVSRANSQEQENINIPHGAFGVDSNIKNGDRAGQGAANPVEVQPHVVEVAPMATAQAESRVKVPGLIQNVVAGEGVNRVENNPANVFQQNNNPVFQQNNPPVNVFQQNNPPVNVFPQNQPQRTIGGLQINWDWDDFSISFENYGAAEMKYYTKKEKTVFTLDPKFSFIVTGLEAIQGAYRGDAVQDMYDNLQNAEGTHLEAPEPKYNSQLYRTAPNIKKIAIKGPQALHGLPKPQVGRVM